MQKSLFWVLGFIIYTIVVIAITYTVALNSGAAGTTDTVQVEASLAPGNFREHRQDFEDVWRSLPLALRGLSTSLDQPESRQYFLGIIAGGDTARMMTAARVEHLMPEANPDAQMFGGILRGIYAELTDLSTGLLTESSDPGAQATVAQRIESLANDVEGFINLISEAPVDGSYLADSDAFIQELNASCGWLQNITVRSIAGCK